MYAQGHLLGLAPKPPSFGSHQSGLSIGQCVLTPPGGIPRGYSLDPTYMSDIQRRAQRGKD